MSIASEITRLNAAKSQLIGKMQAADYEVTGNEALEALVSMLNLQGGESVPVGTVIYYAGRSAPSGFLVCDGAVYDISAYPGLAQFFADNYEANNYWGGDGEGTFAVPDWQGEFFRAAGTQSRANQGSGAVVGLHQDATEIRNVVLDSGQKFRSRLVVPGGAATQKTDTTLNVNPVDGKSIYASGSQETSENPSTTHYTARPTSTSLLVCIKAT